MTPTNFTSETTKRSIDYIQSPVGAALMRWLAGDQPSE
jgi:hypothetical protein